MLRDATTAGLTIFEICLLDEDATFEAIEAIASDERDTGLG